jgi:O-antigen ligase
MLLAPVALSAAYVLLQTILGVNGLFAPPTEYLTFSYVSDAAKLMGFTYRYSAMSWAIAFILPIPLALALGAWRQSRSLHWGWIALFVLLLASLVFGRGRGGLLAGFLGIGVVVWKLAPGKLRLWTLLLGVGTSAALLWTNSSYLEEYVFKGKFSMNFLLDDGISGSTINSLTSGRTDIWQVALEHIIENPFVGFGLGNSSQLWRSISATANTHLHNLYLNVAVEAGVIPAFFAVGMMVYIIVVYYRRMTQVVDTKSQTIPDVAIWMVASYGIMIAYFVSTLVELGSMFASRYMGFPFWVSLAALDILLLQTSPETSQHQNSPKSVTRNPRLGSHPAR